MFLFYVIQEFGIRLTDGIDINALHNGKDVEFELDESCLRYPEDEPGE